MDGGAGTEQQKHGARFFGLTRNEFARVDEGAHAVGVSTEAHVEATCRDKPRPLEPERVAEAAALLLEHALRKYPFLLVANGSHDNLFSEPGSSSEPPAGRTTCHGPATARGELVE